MPRTAIPTATTRARALLSDRAKALRVLHSCIGAAELGFLGYLWFCAVARRRGRLLNLSVAVLGLEGLALLAANECPLGPVQRRAGDDVPMFELWFGPRFAPVAVPAFTAVTVAGLAVMLTRPPGPARKILS